MLSKLKISRDIAGIRFQQFFEMSGRGLVVAGLRTFESESVASKSVGRLFGDKLLQHLAACFLRWRHGVRAIIASYPGCAKRAHRLAGFAHISGHGLRRTKAILDTFPHRWAFQVISRQENSRRRTLTFANRLNDVAVTKVVLGKCARAFPNFCGDRESGNSEKGGV